jgi:hypothetical protein
MRHVDPPDAPSRWQTDVFEAGCAWLEEPGKDNRNAARPASLWLKCRDEIGENFAFICCYTVVYVANGQADHFVPWDEVKGSPEAHLAYQWSNIRYSDGWINQSKGKDRLPDPFVVQDDWFELHLPSLELRATGRHPADHDAAIQNLLKRVKDDSRVMKTRRAYFRQYKEGIRPIELVDREAPLLGRALRAHPAELLPADLLRFQAGTL